MVAVLSYIISSYTQLSVFCHPSSGINKPCPIPIIIMLGLDPKTIHLIGPMGQKDEKKNKPDHARPPEFFPGFPRTDQHLRYCKPNDSNHIKTQQ